MLIFTQTMTGFTGRYYLGNSSDWVCQDIFKFPDFARDIFSNLAATNVKPVLPTWDPRKS